MLQELFRIPGLNLPIYGYGLMLVIGVLCAIELAKFLARHSKIDPEVFATAGMIALLTGILGARLSHVLENWSEFTNPNFSAWDNFLNMINIRSGGLTYYGGLILAFPCVMAYGFWKKVPIRTGMDIIAPALVLGLAFGRIGCFLNGCCYGAETTVPWAVRFPYHSNAYIDQFEQGRFHPPAELLFDLPGGGKALLPPNQVADPSILRNIRANPVHPAQLYSTITSGLICVILVLYFGLPHASGRGMAWMMMLEGPSRFLLELLRVEPSVAGGLSLSMWIGAGLAVLGVILWLVFGVMNQQTKR